MSSSERTRKIKAWYIATLLLALLLIGFGAFHVAMQMRLRDRMASVDLVNQARLLTAQTAVAVERYRMAAGRLPVDLSDLVPAYLDVIPEDPFDGRRLRYRTLRAGYLLYSIGTDETDNDGKERPPERKDRERTPYDVTFVVERP